MKPTTESTAEFTVVPVSDFAGLDDAVRAQAVQAYIGAFGPTSSYNESYTPAEATDALEYSLANGGELMLGVLGRRVISFASGYTKPDGTYYIEELGVAPDQQGKGYGKATFEALAASDAALGAPRLEIRTTVKNKRAIRLYESEGFAKVSGPELAAQMRQDGAIAVDERVYLSRPPLPEAERMRTLKRVAVACPSGNTTAVVFDQLPDADRKALNSRIMRAWQDLEPDKPEIEQCCFVTLPQDRRAIARMEMFGGEFCGNATRSAIWLLTKGHDYTGMIEASGVDRPLRFSVEAGVVAVEMPLPSNGELTREVAEGTLVQLDGIAQLVVTEPRDGQSPRELLTRMLAENAYDLRDQPAVGVSYYDPATGNARFCVWVKAVDTIFDETACGSGTSAIGVALATEQQRSIDAQVVQPSGEAIRTKAQYDGDKVTMSYIAGNVGILYDGEVVLP